MQTGLDNFFSNFFAPLCKMALLRSLCISISYFMVSLRSVGISISYFILCFRSLCISVSCFMLCLRSVCISISYFILCLRSLSISISHFMICLHSLFISINYFMVSIKWFINMVHSNACVRDRAIRSEIIEITSLFGWQEVVPGCIRACRHLETYDPGTAYNIQI